MLRYLLISLSGLAAAAALAQSAAITMDGRFDDWTSGLSTFTDNNAPAAGIDLLSMQVTNDADYLYIRLDVGSEIDLLDDLVPQTIRLYIDADNASGTGTAVQSGYGADLQVKFDSRTCTQWAPTATTVSWSALDLVPLPTTTSTTFEIALARNAIPDGVHPAFTAPTIKILFRESDNGDQMPNSGTVFSYTFDETPVVPLTPIALARASPTDVRMLAWNVLGDGITNAAKQGQYQRLLTAIAPDVIGFSECVTSTATQVKTRLDAWIPLGGSGWYVVKDDYDMVIASRWPITQSWPSLTRQFAALVDLPSAYVTDLLFTAAHLHCCTADANRQNEADEYVRFVQDAMNAGGAFTLPVNTPMIYAGDLNSVGYAQQLSTLLTGDVVDNATYGPDGPMDWDGSAATQANALHTHARMAYTWRNNSSSYPSGRLDHILFADAAAPLTKSFVMRTESMPASVLTSLGLMSTDASMASDHLPLVGDFAVPLAEVRVSARVMLEGPFLPGSGLMHDSLRVLGLLPSIEPYSAMGNTTENAGAAIGGDVLSTTGPNAIVDHVLLELRDATTPSVRVAARSALVQRDGDMVDLDGVSPVPFHVIQGSYHLAVRHRNHLSAMTASPEALSSNSVVVDFTSSAAYGVNAMKDVNGTKCLWAGNARNDSALRYVGADNDRDPVLARIGGSTPTATVQGYYPEDVNMDGTVRYVGSNNDRDPILVNIGGSVPTETRAEQLP